MAELVFWEYKKEMKYPHLRAEETLIWNRFIDKYPDYFQKVAYDVTIGTPSMPPGELEENYKRMWEYLTKKKIDVVGVSMDKAYVIEIEPNADIRTIGEVISKRDLFREEYPGFREYFPMIVTDFEKPDMRKLCGQYKIIYFVV